MALPHQMDEGSADGHGDRHTSRLLARALWVALATVCVLGAGAISWFGNQSRDATVETNAAALRNVVLTVERYLSTRIESTDMLLKLALADREKLRQAGTRDLIEVAATANPAVRRLVLVEVDTGRRVYFWSRDSRLGERSFTGAEALPAFRRDADLRRQVGAPTRSGPQGEAVATLARRSDGPNGLVAVAEFDLAAVQTLIDLISIPGNGSLTVYRSDGTAILRAKVASEERPDPFTPAGLLREFERRGPGSVISILNPDGQEFLVAYGPLADMPLAVVATAPIDEVLAVWRRDFLRQMAPYPAALLLLLCIVVLVTKRARRREELEAETSRKSALLEATLENMDQGLMMFDAETRVQVCNSRAVELLELPAELMATHPRFDEVTRLQFAGGEFARTDEEIRDWIAQTGFERTFHSYERERPNGMVLEIRTVPLEDGGAVRTYTDITERKQVEKRIAHAARHDALTGLANRLFFQERLEEWLPRSAETGESIAVICLDLDKFKTVNDTLGHSFGDSLLCQVSMRISELLGESDLVARLGGDEFAILMSGAPQPDSAVDLCDRIVAEIARPFVIEGHQIHVGTSIGISIAPEDGVEPTQLMKNADLALYEAKADGRGRHRRFEPNMAKQMEDRRALEIDMREALGRDEFRLLYQPFLDLRTRRIKGFEALVRWQHPEKGTISPADFIPVAEETGLIVQLGEWVLREACAAAVTWPEDIQIAVNVSGVQFRNANVHSTVAAALLATGLSPRRLELEVTESVLMSDKESCLRALHQLREFGVRIAMDDFGTGYSSLSYLRSYPFDKLKIDRSFVLELGEDAGSAANIIRTIATLATSLGMETTAEGIETEAQLEQVRSAGCDAVQGYLISRPISLQEATRLVEPQPRAEAA